jgi:hypothetical protein
MLRNEHVRFGGRVGETDRRQRRHRAPARPYPVVERCKCHGWRWISGSGIPSRNSSTACAWRSWWGAKRRRTPASTATWCSWTLAAGRPGVPDSRSGDHAEQRADRQRRPLGQPRCCAVHPHASIPTWRRRSFFASLAKIDPRCSSKSVPIRDSASLIRSPARHSTTINPLRRLPYPGVGSVAHDRDDLIDRWRISRVALTLVPGRPPDVKGRVRRRRAPTAGSIE